VNPRGISLYVLAGLQGSGKTTTAAKLGYFLKRNGKSVVLGAADPYRPAGAEQLRVLASENGLYLSRLWKTVKSTLRRFKVS